MLPIVYAALTNFEKYFYEFMIGLLRLAFKPVSSSAYIAAKIPNNIQPFILLSVCLIL